MAGTKISELPVATTLTGAELVPVVQSGATKQTTLAQMPYVPDGTGAVTTTVQAKLRETVSVKDFGAVGDGVTDDTAAIQAALDSVPAYGGQVFFPEGTYLISSTITLPVQRRIALIGEGNGSVNNGYSATVIKKAASLNGNSIKIQTDGSSIEKITVQGVAGNGGDGILIAASRVTLRDVSVFLMGNDGIRIGTDTGNENCNLWFLENCKTKNNTRHGVYVSEGAGALADANAGTCLHLDTQSNGVNGLNLNGTQLGTYVGGAYQNNGDFGIRLSQYAQYNVFLGGDIEANTTAQFRIDSGCQWNYIHNMTLLFASLSISATSEQNRIEVLDHNRLISGIKFPPIPVASSDVNTLDDYKEGTFTPLITGATTAGVGTYTSNVGRYTKIGRLVNFTINITWTAHTGTGNTEITGLPYTSANTTDTFDAVNILQSAGPLPGAGLTRTAFIQPNTSKIQLREFNPATGVVTNSNAIVAAGTFYLSGSYTV